MDLPRRTVLAALAGLAGTALWPLGAHAAPGETVHVVYGAPGPRDQAEELRDVIGATLGPAVAGGLRLARLRGGWIVVYDRSDVRDPADAAIAAAVATRHDTLLRAALELDGVIATTLPASALSDTWDVRYGPPGAVDTLQARWAVVASVLGPGVAKDLVVAERVDGTAHLVWQRRGERARTEEIARHHASLLARRGIGAEAVPTVGEVPRFDAASAQAEPSSDTPVIVVTEGTDTVRIEVRTTDRPAPAPRLAPVAPLPDLPPIPVEAAPAPRVEVPEAPSVEDRDEPDDLILDTGMSDTDSMLADGASDRTPDTDLPLADTGDLDPPSSPDDPALAMPLEDAIEGYVKAWRAEGRLESIERTAWIVYDLEKDETLADINADVSLQAASMIKPFVAVAFLHEVAAGRLVYGPRSQSMMERMIQISDNAATNWLMKAVGGPAATARLLKRHYPAMARNLRLVEYIPRDGRTYLNKASCRDYVALLRAMWRSELPRSAELRRVMNLPGADRLFTRVPEIPAGTSVYDKTGTTAMCVGDMGVLVAPRRDGGSYAYVIVGVVERSTRAEAFTTWVRARADLIRGVSGLTYRWLAARHDLLTAR